MKRGKLGATERAIMQRRGQQHAGHAAFGQTIQIVGMAHAASRIQPAGRGHRLEVRPARG